MADAAFPGPGADQLPLPERQGPPDAGRPAPADQVVRNVAAGGDHLAGGVRGPGVFAGVQPVAVKVVPGVAPPAFRVLDDRAAVQRGGQVSVLIAGKSGLDEGPVRLSQIHDAFPRRGGGNGLGQENITKQRQEPQEGSGFHTIQMTIFFRAFANPICKKPASLEARTDSLTCTKT